MNPRAERQVLVLDDEPFQRLALCAALERAGFVQIDAVDTAEAALERAAAAPPALMLCDINMPGRDGIDVLQGLQRVAPQTAVILVSSLSGDMLSAISRMAQAQGLRVVAALQKPVDPTELAAALTQAVALPAASARPTLASLTDEALTMALRDRRFEPFFEPKLDTENGRVAGFEVLARLPDWEGGWIGPGRFVPRLEVLDKMDDFTLSLLDKALVHWKGWRVSHPHLTLSVNVSAQSLPRPAFAAALISLTKAHQVPQQQIVFEVTESAPLADLSESLESLVRLRMAGFSLAIDDFGTGYSSMQQLSRAPFTELKIDQEFTRHLTTRAEMRAVFESCMVIARKFNLRVCAEGIETPAVLRLSADLGAHELQGWLIQAAIPAEQVPACLNRFADGRQYQEWYETGTLLPH